LCGENNTNAFTSDWAVFDTMIVASIDKDCNYDPSKSTSWKVLETVLSHLNQFISPYISHFILKHFSALLDVFTY